MTLTDTGPLVALIIEEDVNHQRCAQALALLRRPFVTTWPCVAEAMHLLGRMGGHPAQDALWDYLDDGTLEVHIHEASERRLMRAFMQRYRDTPMDLADASLVVAAHSLNTRRVFTLDSDFLCITCPMARRWKLCPNDESIQNIVRQWGIKVIWHSELALLQPKRTRFMCKLSDWLDFRHWFICLSNDQCFACFDQTQVA